VGVSCNDCDGDEDETMMNEKKREGTELGGCGRWEPPMQASCQRLNDETPCRLENRSFY